MKIEMNVFDKKQVEKSVALAEKLHKSQESVKPNLFSKRIGPIINAPQAKIFLIRMMDTSFRSSNFKRTSAYVLNLIKTNNSYRKVFSKSEKALMQLFRYIGHQLPVISIPLMLQQVKKVTSPILFFIGDAKFKRHAEKRNKEGVRLNVNLIGEALIGEEEAAERIQSYIALLWEDNVDYISIKISTISSQIKPLAFEETVDVLVEKLSVLYHEIIRIEEQTGKIKFVNLDMEEFRDLDITISLFIKTLSLPVFKHLRAGIVLQAYLPDSYSAMLQLQKWAIDRVANGGAPIKVRLVKGANLEMEKTESSFHHWPLATYATKLDTDANYKKILLEILDQKSAPALNIGIASHNVFDLAFALNLVKEQGIESHVDFEMLEGMANELVYELLRQKVNLLLYTPIVKRENYNSAIAYLVRRLDEGTQEGNFLKEGFQLKTNTKKWKEIKKQFTDSIDKISGISSDSNRIQNRNTDSNKIQTEFSNVPDTDWTLSANRNWISEMKKRWHSPLTILGDTIPVVADVSNKTRKLIDIEAWNGIHPWKYEIADVEDYQDVISSSSNWYTVPLSERAKLLKMAALEMEKSRADLIGVAIAELGKTVAEVDVEVSEAIDFANYYAQNAEDLFHKDEIESVSGGINLVLSPWNFPIAIPIGGVLASLAAGKRVILKPSQNAAACGYLIAQTLWKAGIPKSAFAFLPAEESSLDSFLTDGNVFDAVILTGGTETANFLLDRNPKLKLYAETGGKNTTIVTALSDREQAISNVVQSAFGNSGQKCSATSLLILEEEVYNDIHFKTLLKDCLESKTVGNPWNFDTDIGPLAVKVSKKIIDVLNNTDDSQWLVKPELHSDYMLTPGIKWGITPDDIEYKQELFGPILSVMKATNLKDAIQLVDNIDYGLTSGIESLDPKEVDYWLQNIKAGNLYSNRPTTGAIVQRQPFGGIKASCFGFGMKAGGPNYVLQFLNKLEKPIDIKEVEISYRKAYKEHFSKSIDYANLRGQHNINVYLKPTKVIVCLDSTVLEEDIVKVAIAAKVLNVEIEFYATAPVSDVSNLNVLNDWMDLTNKISHDSVVRVLNSDTISSKFLKFCHSKAIHIYNDKPSNYGRCELLNYLTEQNRSINYHRYGNLMGMENSNS